MARLVRDLHYKPLGRAELEALPDGFVLGQTFFDLAVFEPSGAFIQNFKFVVNQQVSRDVSWGLSFRRVDRWPRIHVWNEVHQITVGATGQLRCADSRPQPNQHFPVAPRIDWYTPSYL